MSSPAVPLCAFCGGEVSTRTGFRRVSGWERLRRAGGTNQVVLRESKDVWACFTCIERQRTGRAGQEQMTA